MREIPLTRGYVALVDDEDYEALRTLKWRVQPSGNTHYAIANVHNAGRRTTVRMHRMLLSGGMVDHVNRNGLDNRRENLRVCTPQQNQGNSCKQSDNTSGFKGVCWDKNKSKWRAQIYLAGKKMHVGYYETTQEAAAAYDAKARELFGDFAFLNFPEGVICEDC